MRKLWLILLLGFAILAVGAYSIASHRPFHTAFPSGLFPPREPDSSTVDVDPLPGKLQTFLVMGVDNINGEKGRTDSMVVVSYDSRTHQIAMLSIPRDLWTYIPGRGYEKINHAYAYGGAPLAIETVERLLGIDIDHYVVLSFDGFIEAIDAVGGVEINVSERLYYEDPYDERLGSEGLVIDIKPGPQTMDGITALKYARFRADEQGDVGRMRRQQEVIQALIKRVASPSIISRMTQLIPAIYSTVATDLSVGQILKLAVGGPEALETPLRTGSLSGDARVIDGIFYFTVDLVKARTTAYEVLVGEKPDENFIRKAEQESEVYVAALNEALERSRLAALAAAEKEEAEGGDAEGDSESDSEGKESEEGDSESTDAEGSDSEESGSEDGDSKGRNTDGRDSKGRDSKGRDPKDRDSKGRDSEERDSGGSKSGDGDSEAGDTEGGIDPLSPSTVVSVALIDASGAEILWDYAPRLASAGFRVASTARSDSVVTPTVVIDHSDVPGLRERLQALFPNMVYAYAPDPTVEEDVEIYLGESLVLP